MRHIVLWNLRPTTTSKRSLIGTVVDRLASDGTIADATKLAAEINERERIGNTLIGPGLALPHAQSDTAHDVLLVFVTLSDTRIEWQPGQFANRFLFVIAPVHGSDDETARLQRFMGNLAHDDTMNVLLTGCRRQVDAALGP